MAAAGSMASQLNSKSPTIRRILREAAEMSKSPSKDYTAEPLESDLFEWHFTLRGPPNSDYSEGLYHGRIILPSAYPLRPPNFRFLTPNGRFEANREICLSISGHHEETWQPAWGIRTAIVALRSFMETDARGQLGGLETTGEVRRRLARESRSFMCPTCARSNANIIRESEKQAAQSLSSEHPEVQIPSELSMGWKDELTTKTQVDESGPSPASQRSESQENITESAERAEKSSPIGSPDQRQSPGASQLLQSTVNAPVGSPNSSFACLTPVVESTGSSGRETSPQPRGDGNVLLWVDRAIVALLIALVAILIKMFLT
ncbi:hypothetical protein E4U22_003381 [Claviceps purpurea]|nr:hypothetical protein E4U12_000611 [Claviceps purpurea]KAG6126678.1 hypothetical protein E4U38_006812 [Claviceps purpurea]KAG6127231.1 hypothetical protein E4U28_000191 [Claviceps purpurea]KAG6150132.1 hypothetical protein E4U11_008474 [Claviceps purpurea]KAG6151881.1 hypothetical protein E4U51_000574 [Claviceps purpurea]